jgi:hypothetical protein
MTIARRLLIACLGALAAGGALAQASDADCVALSPADAARVKNIRVMSSVPQDDLRKHTLPMIRTQVQPPVNAGGAGIIGAIIGAIIADAIINADVKRKVEQATLALPSLLEQVKDFDFRGQFWRRLEESLDADNRFSVLETVTFDTERGYLEQPERIRGEVVDALLDLRTEYALSSDLRVFLMQTSAVLQARSDGRELYRCRYLFATPPVLSGAPEAAISAWAADEGAPYRAAAVVGMQQTLKMLRFDLTGEGAPLASGEEARLTGAGFAPVSTGVSVTVRAKLVDREDALIIARDDRGVLRSTIQSERFAPTPEMIAASGAASRPRTGATPLDDLLGAMEENQTPPPAAKETAAEKKAPAAFPAGGSGARRAADADDLGGLLGD